MKKEIVAYLRNGSLEDLHRLLATGITEDEFYQYVGEIQTNSFFDDRIYHVLVLVKREWGKCITIWDIAHAKEMLETLVIVDDKAQKNRCMLFKKCYRVLHMQHTQEHTLEEWVKQLHLYCEEIRENDLVGYVNIDDMFFYTQEEFEEKFYRVTGVCISNLEERTRQQLYNELGRVLTRGGNEAKIKHIIGKIL